MPIPPIVDVGVALTIADKQTLVGTYSGITPGGAAAAVGNQTQDGLLLRVY